MKNEFETPVASSPDAQQAFVSFLFDADHPSFGTNYGTPCEDAFLRALARVDKQRTLVATVRRGDILARNLARIVSRVVIPPVSPTARFWTGHKQTVGTDRRRLLTIVGDLADSLANLWQTVGIRELPRRLAGANVYCLSVFPVPLVLAMQIDARLRAFKPYLGALQIDIGNPVHLEVFHRLLTCVYFRGGTMYASRWDTDEGLYQFGKCAARYFTVKELSYWDFKKLAPKLPKASLSSRGQESLRRLTTVTKATPFERVADALIEHARAKDRAPVEFTLLSPDEEQLQIPVSKLLNYALSTEHRDGRHKARLFSDLLGIHSEEWRYLAYQISNALPDAGLSRVRVTEHGVKFTALVQVIGLNDRTCTVETGWIIRSHGPAQLLTAYPASKQKQCDSPAARPPWVPINGVQRDRWAAIYTAAIHLAAEAASAHVPTPVQYVGFEVELEGECGAAAVRLDGRTAFARWLVANGHALPSSGDGVRLYLAAPTQSADRARVFASTFARVLWLNGVDGAQVETYVM